MDTLDLRKDRPKVEVYSLSTSEWRMLSASASLPPVCAIISLELPAFANVALHWIAVTNVQVWECSNHAQLALGGMVRLYWKMTEMMSCTAK